jgi:hypothetical protein
VSGGGGAGHTRRDSVCTVDQKGGKQVQILGDGRRERRGEDIWSRPTVQGLPCLHLAAWEVWESFFGRMKEMRGRFDAILATAVCLSCALLPHPHICIRILLSTLTSLFQHEFPSHVCCFNPGSSSFTRWSRGGQQTYAA